MSWNLYVFLSYFSSHPFSLGGITGREIEEHWSVCWYYRLLLLLLLVFGWFCVVLFRFEVKIYSLLLSEVERILNSGVFYQLYYTWTWTIMHAQGTLCGDKPWCGWDPCLWRGSLATREPEDLCVLWAKPYAKWKPEAVSCGPNPSLRSLGLQSLMMISVREERL